MKPTPILCRPALLLGLLAISPASLADGLLTGTQENQGKFYAGASLLNTDASCNYKGVDCEGIGWKAAAGYKFNDNWAVEGGYYNLFSNDGTAEGKKAATNGTSIALSTIGFYNVNPKASVSGKVGLFAWRTEGSTAGVTDANMSGTNMLLGIGGGYKLNGNWQLRGEYEAVGGDLDANIYSLGATLSTL